MESTGGRRAECPTRFSLLGMEETVKRGHLRESANSTGDETGTLDLEEQK